MNTSDNLYEPILNRETLYAGKYIDLEKLKIQLPNGKSGIREVVRVKDAIAVLLVDEENNAHLIRQHRPAIDKTIIEIPAGLIDDGEEPEEAAKRECEEEMGFIPEKLTKLIMYAHAEGYSTGFITLFLGTQLVRTGNINLDETEFLEPVMIPYSTLLSKVIASEFIDSKTILAVLLSEKLLELINS